MKHHLLLLLLALAAAPLSAESVQVTVPTSVYFNVDNVATSTSSASNPVLVTFQAASLDSGKVLRLRLRPSASVFSTQDGAEIPAAKLRWTIGGATGGTGFSGTADAANFVTVFQSNAQASSGTISLNLILDAPGSGVRATDHTLAIEWLFESVPQ
jgi:hypothetical protein